MNSGTRLRFVVAAHPSVDAIRSPPILSRAMSFIDCISDFQKDVEQLWHRKDELG